MWKRSHGRTSKAPPDERGGYRYVRPTATAPHLDFTSLLKLGAVIRTLSSRRERGELGQGRVGAAHGAAWMPLTKTGAEPRRYREQPHSRADLTGFRFVRGRPANRPPHDGFEGSAVQAHSTWFTEQRLVRRHGDRDGLDRSRRPARSTRPLIGAAPGLSYAAVGGDRSAKLEFCRRSPRCGA